MADTSLDCALNVIASPPKPVESSGRLGGKYQELRVSVDRELRVPVVPSFDSHGSPVRRNDLGSPKPGSPRPSSPRTTSSPCPSQVVPEPCGEPSKIVSIISDAGLVESANTTARQSKFGKRLLSASMSTVSGAASPTRTSASSAIERTASAASGTSLLLLPGQMDGTSTPRSGLSIAEPKSSISAAGMGGLRSRLSLGSQRDFSVIQRTSLRSMQTSTYLHTSTDEMPQRGWQHFRRRAGPRCRALIKMKSFQAIMLLALMAALFFPDLWILFDRPTNKDMDVMLTGVLLLFLTELVVQSIGLARTYLFTFFFWMDLLGAMSLCLDISYLPIEMGSSGDVSSNVVVMRMARVAKLGARAGRFTRLVKLLRFLPGLSDKGVNLGTAKLVSTRLTTMLSTRVSCLIIIMVMILPVCSVWTYPTSDWSAQAWLDICESLLLLESLEFQEQLDLFTNFYSDKVYFPFLVQTKGVVALAGSAATALPWASSTADRGRPARAANIVRYESAFLVVDFNFKQPSQMQSLMNVLLMVFIMLLMIGFSLILSNSVSAIVLQPLERLLLQVRMMASTIFASVASLAAEGEDAGLHTSEASEDEGDASHRGNVFGSEAKLLEKVLKRLCVFSDLGKTGLDAATMAGMGEGDREMINGLVGAEKAEAWGAGEDEGHASVESDPSAAEKAQMAMIESAGLSGELLNSWNINPLELDSARNRAAVTFFLGSHNHGVKFDPVMMGQFLVAVEAGYIRSSPYHNWYHAVDVTHGVYRLLRLCGAEHYVSSLDRFALLVSATAHDVGHPGLNNIFLVESSHELALVYNDKSPLENLHCARLFEICSKNQCNIFSLLRKHQYQDVRKVCIEAILHTDNVHHFPMIKEVQMFYEVNSEILDGSRKAYSKDKKTFPTKDTTELMRQTDSRKMMLKLLLHVADISNPSKPFRICHIWANKVLEEFFSQGDQERKVGIPVQALNDREKVNRASSQVGFIEFLCAPLMLPVAKVLPPLIDCVKQMVENTETWRQAWLKETKPEPTEAERMTMAERVRKLDVKYREIVL